jgi:hypothetical protein
VVEGHDAQASGQFFSCNGKETLSEGVCDKQTDGHSHEIADCLEKLRFHISISFVEGGDGVGENEADDLPVRKEGLAEHVKNV